MLPCVALGPNQTFGFSLLAPVSHFIFHFLWIRTIVSPQLKVNPVPTSSKSRRAACRPLARRFICFQGSLLNSKFSGLFLLPNKFGSESQKKYAQTVCVSRLGLQGKKLQLPCHSCAELLNYEQYDLVMF